jgi:hypothetical protein
VEEVSNNYFKRKLCEAKEGALHGVVRAYLTEAPQRQFAAKNG